MRTKVLGELSQNCTSRKERWATQQMLLSIDKTVKTSLSEKKEKKNMTKTTDQRIVKIW